MAKIQNKYLKQKKHRDASHRTATPTTILFFT